MKRQIVLLGLVLLYVAYCRAHPFESKINAQFISALRDEIREFELLNEAAAQSTVNEDKNINERSSCINLGNDGCVNGSIVGSGGDGGYLAGGGNPGK